nr:MAG TPA: 30S ribosomal protein S2 [Caudoviricetes sp.]
MRLIDADALKKYLLEHGFYPAFLKAAIKKAPSVDAESVIRCKDCGNFRQNVHGVCWCDEYGGAITPNDYCSRAKKD